MRKQKLFVLICSSFLMSSALVGCGGNDGPFTIKFVNYDGKVLETLMNVKKGEEVSYSRNKPVHFDDSSSYYVFAGWDKEVTVATKDETYTATYNAFPLTNVPENPDSYVDVLPDNINDGATLHAFCWTFNQIKEQLPYIAEAGYKSVQTLPVQTPKSNGSAWWAFYQPLSFSIATESPLGTKQDLEDLCTEAETYGIKIIVDVVFNHMANVSDKAKEDDGTPTVFSGVATYEPYIYDHRNDTTNPTFHHNMNAEGSGSDTQYYPWGNLPDLNTANEYVQERALAFLKECIDVGVDGFRFDAAKHIETPDDPEYTSDFWPNTLGEARNYYRTKTGDELFAYGEILGKPANRNIKVYTDLMSINDENYCTGLIGGYSSLNASLMAKSKYRSVDDPKKLVNWLESHDTYITKKTDLSNEGMALMWAVLASRKDTHGLYLARTDYIWRDEAKQPSIGVIGDYFFRNECLGAVNRFHNRFVGAEEVQSSDGTIYYNERYSDTDKGAVVVDLNRSSKIVVDFQKLGTDVYYDQLTGKAVTVRNGHATIELGKTGIAVLTKTKNAARPELEISDRGGLFVDSKDITVSYTNASEANYQINGGEKINFNSGSKITINASQVVDDKVTLTINLKNGDEEYHESFVYKKAEIIPGYFNVLNLSSERLNNNELYIWSWRPDEAGHWSKDYSINGNTLLIDSDDLGIQGFILGAFPKDYVITNPNEWDFNVIKQTPDIVVSQGYYDASEF